MDKLQYVVSFNGRLFVARPGVGSNREGQPALCWAACDGGALICHAGEENWVIDAEKLDKMIEGSRPRGS